MDSDEFEVLPSDVCVEIFHVSESFLVVAHQIVDVLVLSLFDLMNFDFQPQLQLLSKALEFLLVVGNEILLPHIQSGLQAGNLLIQVSLVDLYIALMSLVLFFIGLLEIHFVLPVVLLCFKMESQLLGLILLGVRNAFGNVFQVLYFLRVDLEFGSVLLFTLFHRGFKVSDVRIELVD